MLLFVQRSRGFRLGFGFRPEFRFTSTGHRLTNGFPFRFSLTCLLAAASHSPVRGGRGARRREDFCFSCCWCCCCCCRNCQSSLPFTCSACSGPCCYCCSVCSSLSLLYIWHSLNYLVFSFMIIGIFFFVIFWFLIFFIFCFFF